MKKLPYFSGVDHTLDTMMCQHLPWFELFIGPVETTFSEVRWWRWNAP